MKDFFKNNNLKVNLDIIKGGSVSINLEFAEKDLVDLCEKYIKSKTSISIPEIKIVPYVWYDWDGPYCRYEYEFTVDPENISDKDWEELETIGIEENKNILITVLEEEFGWARCIHVEPREVSQIIEGEHVTYHMYDVELEFKQFTPVENNFSDIRNLIEKSGDIRILERKNECVRITDFYMNGDGDFRISRTAFISKDDYKNEFAEILEKEYPGKLDDTQIAELNSEVINNFKKDAIANIESYVDTWIFDEEMDSFKDMEEFFNKNTDITSLETKGYLQSVVDFFATNKELYCCICQEDK